MVLKRKLPSRVQQEQPAPAVMLPAAPSTAAVSMAEDTAPVFAAEAPLAFADEASPVMETRDSSASGPVDLTVSTPESNSMKRKVRSARAREFTTMLPEAPKPSTRLAASVASAVPQTNVDFDKIIESLSTLGVVEAAKDTLTASVAPQAAEMESLPPAPAPMPEMAPPAPEPASKATKQPDWLAELTKELNAAMPKDSERDPKRDALGLPPPPTLPPNLLSGLIADEGPGTYTPPAEPVAAPAVPKQEASVPATSQSDVPWAKAEAPKDDWSLDLPASKEATGLPPGPTQPSDIYAGVGKDVSAGTPPWQSAGGSPAELPGSRMAFQQANHGMSMGKMLTTGAVLALVVGGAWWLVVRGDKTQEQLARLTGSLRETTEKLPTDMGGAQAGMNGQGMVQPAQTIGLHVGNDLLPPPDAPPNANAVIDFADVLTDQANKPIVADGSEKMPEDVSFIAKFQQAVAEKKAERMESVPAPDGSTVATTGNPALDKTIRNNALKAQLDAELAAYRKALVDASTVAEAPRPGEFLGQAEQPAKPYMNAAEAAPASTDTEGNLLPPPADKVASKDGLPPAAAYGNNPSNLPILPEPTSEMAKVRTLADFDVAMFEPEEDKVRIPKGIRPRMSTSDFPEMDVLSLVPNKGLIAYKNGSEGVLLIGEVVDGWQLVQVGADSAEFKNGGRSYYVSSEQ